MSVPRIASVNTLENLCLLVVFENGIERKYDIKKLFDKFPAFKKLQDVAVFTNVKVEVGGIAIIWNEELDLSRYEIWENGEEQSLL